MDIFAMGEYGAFVWSSYLLTLAVVVVGIVQGRRRHRKIADGIRRQLAIKESEE